MEIEQTLDEVALKEIYESAFTPCFASAYNILRDKHKAEDVVHDVFLWVLQNPQKIDRSSNYVAFLVARTSWKCRDLLKQMRTRGQIHDYIAWEHETMNANGYEAIETNMDFENTVKELKISYPQGYDVVIKRIHEGKSWTEIGREIRGSGVSRVTQIHSAKEIFGNAIEMLTVFLLGKERQ